MGRGARIPSGSIGSPRGTITWRDTCLEEQTVRCGHSAFDRLREMRLLIQEVGEKQRGTSAKVRVDKMKWLYKVNKLQKELRLQKAGIRAL